MLEAEAPYRRRVVVPHALLLGVESHALADDRGLGACGAPDGVGHLEAHSQDAVGFEFGGAGAEGMFVVEFVAGGRALDVRRDVSAHVEALHGDGFAW